jgi:hypothetical protein
VLEPPGKPSRIEQGRVYEPGSAALRHLCEPESETGPDDGPFSRADIVLDRGETVAGTVLEIAPIFARTGDMVGALGLALADVEGHPALRRDGLLRAASQLSLRLGFARAMRVASASPDCRSTQKIA